MDTLPADDPIARNHGAEAERVIPRRDKGQRNDRLFGLRSQVFRFQPRAQPRVVDLGFAIPEIRLQTALDMQVIELKLNNRNVLGKIAANVRRAHMKSSEAPTLTVCFYNHDAPALSP